LDNIFSLWYHNAKYFDITTIIQYKKVDFEFWKLKKMYLYFPFIGFVQVFRVHT